MDDGRNELLSYWHEHASVRATRPADDPGAGIRVNARIPDDYVDMLRYAAIAADDRRSLLHEVDRLEHLLAVALRALRQHEWHRLGGGMPPSCIECHHYQGGSRDDDNAAHADYAPGQHAESCSVGRALAPFHENKECADG